MMTDYAKLTDEQLQSLSIEGDRTAEEYLVQRYMRLVRVCARPLFLAGGDSWDLIQEGMFGLLAAIQRYKPEIASSFHTYAESCIRNRLRSAVRSASRLKHLPLNDGVSLEQLSDDSGLQVSAIQEIFRQNPEDVVLARESKEELYNVFSQCLSKLEKQVLGLFLEGLSYREIAQRLHKDEKAVDNAVQRIRRKLAHNLNPGDISID